MGALGEIPMYLLLPGILAQTVLSLIVNGSKAGFGTALDLLIVVIVNWSFWFLVFGILLASIRSRSAFWKKP